MNLLIDTKLRKFDEKTVYLEPILEKKYAQFNSFLGSLQYPVIGFYKTGMDYLKKRIIDNFSFGTEGETVIANLKNISIEDNYEENKPNLYLSHDDFIDTLENWIPVTLKHNAYKELSYIKLNYLENIYRVPNIFNFWIETKAGCNLFGDFLKHEFNEPNKALNNKMCIDNLYNLVLQNNSLQHTLEIEGNKLLNKNKTPYYKITMNSEKTILVDHLQSSYYKEHQPELEIFSINIFETQKFLEDIETWYNYFPEEIKGLSLPE